MEDYQYDKKLNIETREEQIGYPKSFHYHRYEATPYSALETLFEKFTFKSNERIVDFGCGKGRLNFYAHYFQQASVMGVEMDEHYFQSAMKNKVSYSKVNPKRGENLDFHCCLAENYKIEAQDSIFYFFNPFSVQIFMKVINGVLQSVESHPRTVHIILYYPSEDYIYHMEKSTPFHLHKEIKLMGRFKGNLHERFLIYRV